MAIVSGTAASLKGPISTSSTDLVDTVSIVNESFPTAGVEQAIVIPVGTRKAFLKTRNKSVMKIAYVLGDSGVTYLSIYPGDRYEITELKSTATLTLYIQCSKAAEIVEIEFWS